MKFIIKISFLFFGFCNILFAQTNNAQYNNIDVQHYKLTLSVNDSTDVIDAEMEVSIKFKRSLDLFELDLITKDSTGIGMQVDSVYQNNIVVDFSQKNNKLAIEAKHVFPRLPYTYTIKYSGIPKDGLIISENMYGDRTFFGDNWPNRAHNWFPCVDHPSDKATIEYFIKAPNHYQVIANGYQVEETNLTENLKQYHYKTKVPLPTKVMVIGIAKFAVQNTGITHNIPVSTWVYPQTKAAGFNDFAIAKDILDFFIEKIGDYPFQKLANVQSKTRYGGMENAGNIFYFEKSVTGNQEHKDLIAHEIAHQWFGNSATEIEWSHLWLSEGFATYFTNLYILEADGETAFKKRLTEEREKVLNFYKMQQTPIIDTKTTDYLKLLNPNSYQKGAWVLHMLKATVGEENFWKGIKTYYNFYKFKNASSNDFKNVMAQVSGKNLDVFFTQWLQKTGQPKIKASWIHGGDKLRIMVEQLQETTFEFPLDLEIIYSDGTSEIKTVEVTTQKEPFVVTTKALDVKEIKYDPNVNLLFEMDNE
ncbi:M1 family metallopeptidase [Lutibacter sp. A80]|uniref:M1 family metallopeptidase n=1 Tax=Lutibacter sp. A80 TaxID=2918453 RepID=UPI001F05C273|nr:M1 family metallopeptidase [Lutibacter sp. A80]UMB62194.1 M1 family metallopeptidase [Lutibacter sp. A80]